MHKYEQQLDLEVDNTLTRIIKSIGSKGEKNVLELGCASGYATRLMKEHFQCEVTCVELVPELALQAEPFAKRVILGDLNEFDPSYYFKHGEFDAITFGDLLEHLYDPWEVVKKFKKYLRPGGTLYISVPNIGHASIIIDLIFGKFEYRKLGLMDNTHIRWFTRDTLQKMLEDAEYQDIKIQGLGLHPSSTELGTNMSLLPQEVANFILSKEDTWTYQFLIEAKSL